jgi:hypothetical protein
VTLPRARFSPALLDELLAVAPSQVSVEGDWVLIRHVYIERRLTPLNLVLEGADERAREHAIDEYGRAIRELAAVNIFAGDLLFKNFGLTRYGRVVFYDYDEIEYMVDCTFRTIPPPPPGHDEMSGEVWYRVGPRDVFPEEFATFLLTDPRNREAFFVTTPTCSTRSGGSARRRRSRRRAPPRCSRTATTRASRRPSRVPSRPDARRVGSGRGPERRSAVAPRRSSAALRVPARRGDTPPKVRARPRRRAAWGERVAYLSLFTVLRPGPGPSSCTPRGRGSPRASSCTTSRPAGSSARSRAWASSSTAAPRASGATRAPTRGRGRPVGRRPRLGRHRRARGAARRRDDPAHGAPRRPPPGALRSRGRHRLSRRRALAFGGSAARFAAFDAQGSVVADRVYVPVGDDEIVGAGDAAHGRRATRVPYDYAASADALIDACRAAGGRRVGFVALANEGALLSPGEVRMRLLAMARAMRASVQARLPADRGAAERPQAHGGRARRGPRRAHRDGPAALPRVRARRRRGECRGRDVGRRAVERRRGRRRRPPRARGRPPARARRRRGRLPRDRGRGRRALRRAGMKQVGCQGEIGVAAAMGAAGMASALGGTPAQVLHAAELALEPHLGLACDPVGGRVESPCIERNGLAAARACAAASAAIRVPEPRVALDAVVRTMVETSRALAGATSRPRSAAWRCRCRTAECYASGMKRIAVVSPPPSPPAPPREAARRAVAGHDRLPSSTGSGWSSASCPTRCACSRPDGERVTLQKVPASQGVRYTPTAWSRCAAAAGRRPTPAASSTSATAPGGRCRTGAPLMVPGAPK